MKRAVALLFLALSFSLLTPADGGHELPIYPSFYPQEIRIEVVEPGTAASLLQGGRIHAYLGGEPRFGGKVPDQIRNVESLGSYLLLTVNPSSPALKEPEARCSAVEAMVGALADHGATFVFHPYPVTPFDSDYLYHFDLAGASKRRYLTAAAGRQGPQNLDLKMRAKGELAERLVKQRQPVADNGWDVTVEEVDAGDLVASHTVLVNGWLGPPWVKEGWFHAYLLLAEALRDATARGTVVSIAGRLERGDYEGVTEKLNLERKLVRLLTRGCERLVVGYTLKRWYFNADYSAGIENIAYDSHTGFASPLFIRTVKLKDFPWNGWLRLGIDAHPSAAWNPVGGFTDPFGRLIWFAVGDPALIPSPYNGSWILNRIEGVRSRLEAP